MRWLYRNLKLSSFTGECAVVEAFLAEVPIQLRSELCSFQRLAVEEIAVTKSEMEVHGLRIVKLEENPHEFNFPQSLNQSSNERQYHDPTMLESVPLAKFERALNPLVEQLSAALQATPNVETDNVHHANGLEPLADAASDTIPASEMEEPPNARTTEKAQVVAEMVDYAFSTCEGSNYNPGTKMMVSNLLQFLCKQYEEDKAFAVVEIGRLKDEKMKLEEQRNLALENFQKSESELEELKKVGKSSRDLEHENEELKSVILTMGVDMDVLQEKYNTVQSAVLSTRAGIEKLTNEKLKQYRIYEDATRSSLQQVNLLKATIRDRDNKIDLLNEEMTVLRERMGKETYHIPKTIPNLPVVISNLKQVLPEVPQCDADTQETQGPKPKRARCNKDLDCASVSTSGSMNALTAQKFGAELSSLMTAIMTLGKALDCKLKDVLPVTILQTSRERQWNHCIRRIVPPGYHFDTFTQFKKVDAFKFVWNHWISAVMFYDFEDTSFGVTEVLATPESLDANTKPGMLDGNSNQFLAFVRRKHQLLFPPWMYQPPLLKILDSDIYSKFKVIAEKVWMLHQVGRSWVLPPSIFRPVPSGTRYDSQYHESRSPLPGGTEKQSFLILLVYMPGFVVGETIIKSQVVVRKML